MITVAYIGFGVSVREYHIPYVENREASREMLAEACRVEWIE